MLPGRVNQTRQATSKATVARDAVNIISRLEEYRVLAIGIITPALIVCHNFRLAVFLAFLIVLLLVKARLHHRSPFCLLVSPPLAFCLQLFLQASFFLLFALLFLTLPTFPLFSVPLVFCPGLFPGWPAVGDSFIHRLFLGHIGSVPAASVEKTIVFCPSKRITQNFDSLLDLS